MSCQHRKFESAVKVNRITENDSPDSPVTGYSADIQVRCAECGQHFYWIAPIGVSPNEPRASADNIELRAPLTPVKGLVHSTERMQITQHVGVEIVRAPRPQSGICDTIGPNQGSSIENSQTDGG